MADKKQHKKEAIWGVVITVVSLIICLGIIRSIQPDIEERPIPTKQNTPKTIAKPPQTTTDLPYRIVKTERMLNIKLSLDFEWSQKPSKATLTKVAKANVDTSVKRTFMCHRIVGQNEGPCWATTHANPDLKIQILGIQKGVKFAKPGTRGKIIGTWNNNTLKAQLSIIKTRKGYVSERIFADHKGGKGWVEKLKRKGNKYHLVGDSVYYTIDKQRRLRMWGKSGNYDTLLPVKK